MTLKRYQEFYVPYIRLFYEFYLLQIPYYVWVADAAHDVQSLVMSNLEYIDANSLVLVPKFHRATNNLYGSHETATIEFIQVFDELTNSVLSESIKLSRELHLPSLGQAALDVYSELSYDKLQKSLQEEH